MEDIVPEELSTIKLNKQSTKLWFQKTTNKPLPLNLFTDLLFTQNSKDITCNIWCSLQQLELSSNYYSAELVFNYYVNDKITDCLRGTINIESAKKNFYTKLFQHTSLPRNHSFAPIIRKINQTIERYMQQQFPITYADKGKGRIQIPAATTKEIQLPSWKKHRVELPITLSYHYTPESAINISSADMSTLNATSTFGRFQFQSKQQKEDLLGPYATTLWELSEEEEKESEDQRFTYQNPISENSKFGTPNTPDLINQPNVPLNIVIDHPPIDLIVKPIQQPPQQLNPQIHQPQEPPQQPPPLQQQPLQQLPQQLNVNQMAYTPITMLENFTALQVIPYFFKETADSWYQSLAARPQTFQQFKTAFLEYFSNNNSINCLANTFTTIKQNNTEAVTTYLGCFHRVLRQIQAIDTVYFTEPQILNQFICGLRSSILQHVCLLHPANLQATVTHARDFESAELKANHA
ncbi:hypothetical protein G9A89_007094 [Geosiphon pyriformis]|nr:hypothetical protein G9A89_007094 [Geosiphon pyriformis]